MEDEYVQALQYTPHPGPSLEVVHTLSLHTPRCLSPLPSTHSVLPSCLSDSNNLRLEMPTSGEVTNQPRSPAENMAAGTGDGREPGSSAGGGVPPPEVAQGANPPQVRVVVFTYRIQPTITPRTGLIEADHQGTGATCLGNCSESPSEC